MKKIKIAIVGVGNCASSLVQGIEYYKNADENTSVVGLMNVNLGGYHINQIEIVAAFDINKNKIGKDVSEAIFVEPNNTTKFADVQTLGAKVYKAPKLDGIGKYVEDIIPVDEDDNYDDPIQILKDTGAEIIINYLPVGSEEATKFWADIAINARCGFINCIPVFIASNAEWNDKFAKSGIPIIGDDIKSQVGATIVHRTLTNLFLDRGMPIDRTYQLNTGGNLDFLNMLERDRLSSKKISKTNAVTSQLKNRGIDVDEENVHVGPSDYVPWQKDNKICYIRIESRHFGDVPMNLELRLSVEDSPNSAGVVIDAIRCMKLGLNNNLSGALIEPSAYFKKTPPVQMEDREARAKLEEFISKYRMQE